MLEIQSRLPITDVETWKLEIEKLNNFRFESDSEKEEIPEEPENPQKNVVQREKVQLIEKAKTNQQERYEKLKRMNAEPFIEVDESF